MEPYGPEVLAAAARANRHLVILCALEARPVDTFAAAHGFGYLNINLVLGERLLPLALVQRRSDAKRLLEQILADTRRRVLVLDRIDLLFEPTLQVDALGLLRDLAANRTLIVRWPGSYANGYLLYGDQTHPEYKRVSADGLLLADYPL